MSAKYQVPQGEIGHYIDGTQEPQTVAMTEKRRNIAHVTLQECTGVQGL